VPRPTRPPAPPVPPSTARAERAARSIEEPLDVRLKADDPYPLLEVRNPIRRTAYLVMLPEFPARSPALCTCTDFARRDLGTCKHLEAAYRWRTAHADARPPARSAAHPPSPWGEIDRRERELPPPGRITARELARPGASLYEPAGPSDRE